VRGITWISLCDWGVPSVSLDVDYDDGDSLAGDWSLIGGIVDVIAAVLSIDGGGAKGIYVLRDDHYPEPSEDGYVDAESWFEEHRLYLLPDDIRDRVIRSITD